MKPIIFISAVSRELKTTRQLVANTLTAIGFEPDWQDVFGLSPDDIPAMLRKKVDAAHAVLQIVGDAYGAEANEPDARFGRCSYTHYEALYAKSVGKPVYYLVASKDFPRDLSADAIDVPVDQTPFAVADAAEKRRRQAEYKARVLSGSTIYYEVANHDSTENKVRKLKDELDKLRRGFTRMLVVGGVCLALLLTLTAVGLLLQRQASDAASSAALAAAKADEEERERDLKQQIELERQRELAQEEARKRELAEVAVREEREKLLAAIRELSDQVAKAGQHGEEVDSEARLGLAYAALEEKHGLAEGTLAARFPELAAQILADSGSSSLDRQAALYAARRYAEAEALGVEIAEHNVEQAIEALVQSGHAARAEIRYADGLRHYERAAAFTDREADALRWAENQFWVASALSNVGRYADAATILIPVVEARKERLGLDDPDTLKAMNNLAVAYLDAGRLDKALPLHEETLKLRTAKLGPKHPDTLASMNNVAFAYMSAGRTDEALPRYEETLKLRREISGAEHPDTLTSMNNLAGAYEAAGRPADALPLFETTLKLTTAIMGAEHPDTLTSMNNLAVAYKNAGNLDEAIPLHEKTLKLLQAKLGAEHPDTLTSTNNLALAYLAAGRPAEALPLFEATLSFRTAILGAEHPNTLVSMHNLAGAYESADRMDEAIPLHERTLKLMQANLGAKHLVTLTSMKALAHAYEKAGRVEEASQIRQELVDLQSAEREDSIAAP